MNQICFLDIESIPGETMPTLDEISAPANYKDEAKIQAYKEANQVEAWKKQALNSMQGRIICIGYTIDDSPHMITGDESVIMHEFESEMLELFYMNHYIFCGWNISTFDLPWLWRKSIQYNLPKLRKIIPKDNRTEYIDLMKVWASDYKDYVSLDSCAKFLGIPHETEKGNKVFDWWQAGEIDKIADHCSKDILTTKEIYRRIYG